MTPIKKSERPLTVAIVVGEESGDKLGADLIKAIRKTEPEVQFGGVAGERMKELGVESLFPMSDIAVMGVSAVIARLPLILRRRRQTIAGLYELKPDILVIVDSPGFTHSVARKLSKKMPDLPIINYVSPSVWAWKSYRAKRMAGFIDHVLALLPFEPDVHRRLGGPPCTYVGHPLVENQSRLLDRKKNRSEIGEPPVLVVLPGSRRSEIDRLLQPFGEAVSIVAETHPDLVVLLPAVSHLEDTLRDQTANWKIRPDIITGETAKYEAFRRSDVALAASGTVTLELALAHVPMVVAYRVEWPFNKFKFVLKIPSVVLANLVIEENVVPELLDEDSSPDKLAEHVLALFRPGPQRERQLAGFRTLDTKMALPNGIAPSEHAAQIVLRHVGHHSR